MKKFSKDQIREIAADVFGRYPRASRVAVTADGQAFVTDEGDAAVRNHARVNRYKEQLEIAFFNRADFGEEQEEKPENNPPKVAKAPKAAKPKVKKTVPAKEKAEAEKTAGQHECEQAKEEES